MGTIPQKTQRVARAVERARLESVCTFAGTEGSNPSLSASKKHLLQAKASRSFLYPTEAFKSRRFLISGGRMQKTERSEEVFFACISIPLSGITLRTPSLSASKS